MYTYLARSHHHTTTDSVERVGGDTGTSCNRPTEGERCKEAAFKRADEDNGLEGVVHAEVETSVDDDTSDRGHETTVETGDTIGGEGFPVDIDETVELTSTALGGALGIVSETGTGVIERVDEEKRSGTSSTTRCQVTHHPLSVTIALLLESKH